MDAGKNDIIAKELLRLTALGGDVLTPKAVVEAASSPTNPMHDQFNWDDSEAAQLYRYGQARKLITTIRYAVESDTRVINCPVFLRAPDMKPEEQGYRHITEIRNKDSLARDAMDRELKNARSYLYRALAIAEALGMSEEVDHIVKSIDEIRERLSAAA